MCSLHVRRCSAAVLHGPRPSQRAFPAATGGPPHVALAPRASLPQHGRTTAAAMDARTSTSCLRGLSTAAGYNRACTTARPYADAKGNRPRCAPLALCTAVVRPSAACHLWYPPCSAPQRGAAGRCGGAQDRAARECGNAQRLTVLRVPGAGAAGAVRHFGL